jgi:hypothetical protein
MALGLFELSFEVCVLSVMLIEIPDGRSHE